MFAQISLQTSLHVTVPLLKPLKHPTKQLALVLEASRKIIHIGVGWLTLEPDLCVRAAQKTRHTVVVMSG